VPRLRPRWRAELVVGLAAKLPPHSGPEGQIAGQAPRLGQEGAMLGVPPRQGGATAGGPPRKVKEDEEIVKGFEETERG
jgi:hypothetical protein